MVEKIIINPNKVRGYGNIMSPHSSSDYDVVNASLESGTDTVNGQSMTVYELEYAPNLTNTVLSLSVSPSSVYVYDNVVFTAVLEDEDDNPISGATVTFKEGDTVLGTDTTDNTGEASLTLSTLTAGSHSVTANYGGDSTYAGSNSSSVSVSVSHSYSLSFSSSSYAASGGSAEVSVTLTDNSVAVSGATVTFTGGTSTVTGVTNSSGVATATVSVSATSTITATYQNVTDTCTITVPSAYIINDDATTDNSSTLFGSSISLRNNGTATTSYVSASPSYYIIKNTRGSAEAFVPYTDLEGITDSFKLSIESAMHSTSNVCLIGLYYYQDSNNWGGVKAVNSEQWISSKTNGTFTEQSYQTGQSASTTKIRTEMVFDSSANTLTISTYTIGTDTLIQTKTMNIPITIPNDVKWGTTTTWNTNAQHDVYNIKAEYL